MPNNYYKPNLEGRDPPLLSLRRVQPRPRLHQRGERCPHVGRRGLLLGREGGASELAVDVGPEGPMRQKRDSFD